MSVFAKMSQYRSSVTKAGKTFGLINLHDDHDKSQEDKSEISS